MKKLLILLCAFGLSMGINMKVAAGSVETIPYYRDGDVVGFIGDSITHATYTSLNYVEILYQYYLSRFPQQNIEFRNLSADGHRAEDALNTYERDPAFQGINKAVILLGTNNAILKYTPEDYISDMEKLVDRLKADGLKGEDILILSPPICDENCSKNYDKNGRQRWTFENRLLEYMEKLEEKTAEWGVNYIDLHTPMVRLTEVIRKENPDGTLTTDCIHPNAMGQFLIAYYILQAQGADREGLSGVFVPQEGEARVVQGELTDYYRGDRGLCLTWRSDTLPVPATDGLLKFLQFYEPANTLYSERFQVEGLAEDADYHVLMEEKELGVFTGKELAEGIDFATLESHPLQAAVQQMEALDRKRHQNVVSYRKLWIEVAMQRADPTAEEVRAEYEKWRSVDEDFRNEIHAMALNIAGDAVRIYVLEEGYSAEELVQEAQRAAAERAEREAEETKAAAEEQAKREAEEQAKREAEERAAKEAREQAEREAQEQAEREAEEAREELLIKKISICGVIVIAAAGFFFLRIRRKSGGTGLQNGNESEKPGK